jgi:RHS repeat-associated protein
MNRNNLFYFIFAFIFYASIPIDVRSECVADVINNGNLEFTSAGGTAEVEIAYYNTTYPYDPCTCATEPVVNLNGYTWISWARVIENGVYNNNKIKITVSQNTAAGPRSANITFNGFNVSVAQTGTCVNSNIPVISGSSTICSGSTQTYSVTPISGTTEYFWTVNGGTIQSGQYSTSITITNSSSYLSLQVRIKNDCGAYAYGNKGVTVSQYGYLTANISGNNKLCYGNGGEFTASVSYGGSAPTYQWLLNGATVTNNTSGLPANKYKPTTALSDGDQITCTVQSNYTCLSGSSTVTSSPITIERLTCSSQMNSVQTNIYNGAEELAGQSIAYFDELGRSKQSLVQNLTTGAILGSQTIYDGFGRQAISTLAAPIDGKDDIYYASDFVLNPTLDGEYSYINFEKTTVDALSGKLASYYNNGNINEPYVPHSKYPYTRVEYSSLNPGVVRKSALAGEDHCIGSGHESQTYSMPVDASELSDFAEYFEDIGNITLETEGVTKTITVDADKQMAVVYTSTEGQTITSCYVDVSAPAQQIVAKFRNGSRFMDIHFTKASYLNLSKGECNIYDLATDKLATADGYGKFPAGFYRLEYIGECVDNGDGCDFVPGPPDDDVTVTYDINYTGHSFNLYDKAGRLKFSLSPKGFNEWKAETTKTWKNLKKYASFNHYNSLGWLLTTGSPDEDSTEYRYADDGRIRYSQNGQQRAEGKFSYTNYDTNLRPIESGEVTGTFSTANIATNITSGGTQCTYTAYDLPFDNITYNNSAQNYTMGKVSKTWNANCTTYYSYTYDGKTEWVVQKYTGALGTKTIEYEYEDEILGRLARVIYQRDATDQFIHRYVYDLDGRLTDVHTKAGNDAKKPQAHYIYYAHGPLKRVEIAENLQGIDYVYNINGWLKSINSPDITTANDPGGDGAGGTHSTFGSDLFGMALDYYTGDYTRTGTHLNSVVTNSKYNGNITSNRWNNKKFQAGAGTQYAYQYTYNNRGFMSLANFGTATETGGITATGTYNESITDYDLNGNITGLTRHANGSQLDALTYNYYRTKASNQLRSVTDAQPQTAITEDIESQPEKNYLYNKIGQLYWNQGDKQYFTYDVYGHVTGIYADSAKVTPVALYTYDDKGFRIKKVAGGTTTWYARDASGQILSTYLQNATTCTLNEVNLYGSSRLGQALANSTGSINKYQYELTDHLGNVRAVFSDGSDIADKTLKSVLASNADIVASASITLLPGFSTNGHTFTAIIDASATSNLIAVTDYYPFGMEMPVRKYQGSDAYKFGYQGQYAEKDAETGYNHFEARDYDSRIGRWLVPDPAGQFHSAYLGMGNNPVSGVDPDGREKDDVIFDEKGNFVATTESGWSGDVLIVDDKNKHKVFEGMKDVDADKITKQFSSIKLSDMAQSKIYTAVLCHFFDSHLTTLYREQISIWDDNGYRLNLGNGNYAYPGYNNPTPGKPSAMAWYSEDNKTITTRNDEYRNFGTVALIVNILGHHELYGHAINRWNEQKTLRYQMKQPEFQAMPSIQKRATIQYLNDAIKYNW